MSRTGKKTDLTESLVADFNKIILHVFHFRHQHLKCDNILLRVYSWTLTICFNLTPNTQRLQIITELIGRAEQISAVNQGPVSIAQR